VCVLYRGIADFYKMSNSAVYFRSLLSLSNCTCHWQPVRILPVQLRSPVLLFPCVDVDRNCFGAFFSSVENKRIV
jgi:hypothetical protein